MSDRLTGVLLNWRRRPLSTGISLTLEFAARHDGESAGSPSVVTIVFDDQQLHALVQDLGQAATERGIDIRTRPRWRLW